MPEYTVVAAYRDPPSMFTAHVEAEDPIAAIDVAWADCLEGNDWLDADPSDYDRDEEWSDTMVLAGHVEVVA